MTYTVKSEFEQGWVVGHASFRAAYLVPFIDVGQGDAIWR